MHGKKKKSTRGRPRTTSDWSSVDPGPQPGPAIYRGSIYVIELELARQPFAQHAVGRPEVARKEQGQIFISSQRKISEGTQGSELRT